MTRAEMQATARAHSNIAFIKYWGNADDTLRLPVNSSLSMNLDGILTETQVRWDDSLSSDTLLLNGEVAFNAALERVSAHLDVIRAYTNTTLYAEVVSHNNFPMGTGIASSASSFAALTLAATTALGANFSERELTTIARQGSGSASRSIPTGFVEWYKGDSDETSYAESFAPPEHWNLVDLIAIVSSDHKAVTSKRGHTTAKTSDLQNARVAGADERVMQCKQAILTRDFAAFAEVVEHDSNLMHAVMMTSRPPLFYWLPLTLTLMSCVRQWREEGLRVCYTLDAGPNVHCLCGAEDADDVQRRLNSIVDEKNVLRASVGQGAYLVQNASE